MCAFAFTQICRFRAERCWKHMETHVCESGWMISLVLEFFRRAFAKVFCLVNRARGTALVSPEEAFSWAVWFMLHAFKLIPQDDASVLLPKKRRKKEDRAPGWVTDSIIDCLTELLLLWAGASLSRIFPELHLLWAAASLSCIFSEPTLPWSSFPQLILSYSELPLL